MKSIMRIVGLALLCIIPSMASAMEKPAQITINGPHAIAAQEKTFYAFANGKPVGKILFLINPFTKIARIQLIKVDTRYRG